MLNKMILSILIVGYISLQNISGQPSEIADKLRPRLLINYAENAEERGDYYTASDYYLKYHEKKPHKTKYTYKLAEMYRLSRDYVNAQKYYKEVYDIAPNKYEMALYYYSMMLQMNGIYDTAKTNYEKFNKIYSGNENEFKKLLKANIEGCILAKAMMDSPEKAVIFHLDTSINQAHIELSPLQIDEETFIYASYKTNKIEYYNPEDTNYISKVRKFYVAEKKGDNWKGGKLWDVPFNTDGINIGNGAFSSDKTKFYFTRTEKNWKNQNITKIYVSNREAGQWLEPVELLPPVNSSKYSTTMPTVGIDSKKNTEILYFSSDMPDGKGGYDIWYATFDKKENAFTKVKNAGKINTAGNEVTPYYDLSNHRLFFSSDGYAGMGGLDIYQTTGEQGSWSPPENVGYPINSSADDLYYAPGINKEIAFFVSNRKGGMALKSETCCDDIYYLKWGKFMKIDIAGNVYELFAQTSNDTSAISHKELFSDNPDKKSDTIKGNIIKSPTIKLYLLNEETNESYFISSVTPVSDEPYNLLLEQGNIYKLIAEKDGFFSDAAKVSTKDIHETTSLHQNFALKKIPTKSVVLENIYYEYRKYNLTDLASAIIDTTLFILLKDNPDIIIELSSHTDAHASDEFNMKLSQKRAESVVNYLVQKGIDSKRLIAKGYGETKPIAPNTKPDGSDDLEGRAKNRRTEFRVIGSANLESELNKGELKIIYREGQPKGTIEFHDEKDE